MLKIPRLRKDSKFQKRLIENELSISEDIRNHSRQMDRLQKDIKFIIKSKIQRFEASTFKIYYPQFKQNESTISNISPPSKSELQISLSENLLNISDEDFTKSIRHRFLKPKKMDSDFKQYEELLNEGNERDLKKFISENPKILDKQFYGLSMLYRKVKDDDTKAVELLMELGANQHLIQEKWPYRLMTPLRLARQMENTKMIRLLR